MIQLQNISFNSIRLEEFKYFGRTLIAIFTDLSLPSEHALTIPVQKLAQSFTLLISEHEKPTPKSQKKIKDNARDDWFNAIVKIINAFLATPLPQLAEPAKLLNSVFDESVNKDLSHLNYNLESTQIEILRKKWDTPEMQEAMTSLNLTESYTSFCEAEDEFISYSKEYHSSITAGQRETTALRKQAMLILSMVLNMVETMANLNEDSFALEALQKINVELEKQDTANKQRLTNLKKKEENPE